MKYFLIALGIIIFIGFITVSSISGAYNSLVAQREEARTYQSQIEVDLQRRYDLVPNIVATTKGAMSQEQAVFKDISAAYAKFGQAAPGSADQMQAGDQLGSALRGYLVVVQQYPNLRSLDQVRELSVTLEGTENRIAVTRERYNNDVQIYNQHLQTFPTNIIGNMFGFQQMPRFESTSNAKTAPAVDLTLPK